jgi:hypothetical protein
MSHPTTPVARPPGQPSAPAQPRARAPTGLQTRTTAAAEPSINPRAAPAGLQARPAAPAQPTSNPSLRAPGSSVTEVRAEAAAKIDASHVQVTGMRLSTSQEQDEVIAKLTAEIATLKTENGVLKEAIAILDKEYADGIKPLRDAVATFKGDYTNRLQSALSKETQERTTMGNAVKDDFERTLTDIRNANDNKIRSLQGYIPTSSNGGFGRRR